jgi:hypothetical protein
LQHQVYEGKPRETLDEIVPHVVTYDPLTGGIANVEERLQAVIYDCDGRVANEILTNPQAFTNSKLNKLGKAILDADGLVLVIDASSTQEQIDADFHEFVQFLRHFVQHRGKQASVGDLPVFLVLSKCDLLLQAGETAAQWTERIHNRKDQVLNRFVEFLQQEGGGGFGSIAMNVIATAVKRPAVGNLQAQSHEPYGVSELFRSCFRAAKDFRGRSERSHARVLMAVLGGVAAILILAATAVMLYLSRESIQPLPLASSVESYRSSEGQTPSARLTEPLQRKIGVLSDIRNNPDYSRLPPELQDYVQGRLNELFAYRDFRDQLALVRPPTDLRTHEELNQFERNLSIDLSLPAEYRTEWSQTDAAILREKWLDDAKAIRDAVRRLERWQQDLAAEAQSLLLFEDKQGRKVTIPWPIWHERCRKLLTDADTPPFRPNDKLRDSRALPSQRAPSLTNVPAFAFRSVDDGRRTWERSRQRLERLRDITSAIGLGGEISIRLAPLRIADSGVQTIEQIRERVESIKKQFAGHADWTASDIPDSVRSEVQSVAQTAFDHWLATGRQLVAQELRRVRGDSPEKHEHWLQVAEWSAQAGDLQLWRDIAMALQRIANGRNADPIQELARFLREKSFAIEVRKAVLVIPDSVRDSRLQPTSNLTIHVQNGGATDTISCKQSGPVLRDERLGLSTYRFEVDGKTALSFTPGQECWAELTAKDAGREWKLYWSKFRSSTYTYERLLTEPILFPKDDVELKKGLPATRVTLLLEPISGVPRLPDLMPDTVKSPN